MEIVLLEKSHRSAPNDPKMTLNAARPKVPPICCTITCELDISLSFALRSLDFLVMDLFDFSKATMVKLNFSKKSGIRKHQEFKISKFPNIVL